jgi:hypothetical protein
VASTARLVVSRQGGAQQALHMIGLLESRSSDGMANRLAIVGSLERCAGILLDEQDRDAELAQSRYDPEDLSHNQRSKAETRLVEKEQARLRHQRAPERQHLAFSARQGGGQLAAPLGEAREALVDLLQIPLHGFAVPPARIGTQNKIVRYGHLGEEFTALRHRTRSNIIDRGAVIIVAKRSSNEASFWSKRKRSPKEAWRLVDAGCSDSSTEGLKENPVSKLATCTSDAR